jgi:hypothetical protein
MVRRWTPNRHAASPVVNSCGSVRAAGFNAAISGIDRNGEAPDGGRCIPQTPDGVIYMTLLADEGFPALMYAKITEWGERHGLPSDAEYQARLKLAYPPTGKRGHPRGISVQRLRLGETARRWRELGYPERTIATGLLWEREAPPANRVLENLEQRLDRLERDLRKLEAVEGKRMAPRPQRDTQARRRAAKVGAQSFAAGCTAEQYRRRAIKVKRDPHDDPAWLRANAKRLRLQVRAQQAQDLALRDSKHGTTDVYRRRQLGEREELIAVADRLEHRAAELDRKHAHSVTSRTVRPTATRQPGFDPFALGPEQAA